MNGRRDKKSRHSSKTPVKSKSTRAEGAGENNSGPIRRRIRQLGRSVVDSLVDLRDWAWRHKYSFGTLWTLLVAAPPFFVTQYLENEKFGAKFTEIAPSFASAIDSDPIRWTIFAAVWGFLCTLLGQKIRDRMQARPTGWENVAPILLKSLDNIVGKKEQRFSHCLRTSLKKMDSSAETISASLVFGEITQPETQVGEIVMTLHSAFSLLTGNETGSGDALKVNLALLQNGSIEAIMYHYPNDHQVRSSVEQLNSGKSTIRCADKDNRICILESIRDESETEFEIPSYRSDESP